MTETLGDTQRFPLAPPPPLRPGDIDWVTGETVPFPETDIPEPDPEKLPSERFESDRFVTTLPDFVDQVQDESRTNRFRYAKIGHYRDKTLEEYKEVDPRAVAEMSEHEGLVELYTFLQSFPAVEADIGRAPNSPYAPDMGENMLHDISFIGEKEYDEATSGFPDIFKSYLDADPDNKLVVLALVSEVYGKRKSDAVMLETILSHFDDSDRERYVGRLITRMEDIPEDPTKVSVRLIDDVVLSGLQMEAAYGALADSLASSGLPASYLDQTEINLIAASERQVAYGLGVMKDSVYRNVPVRAYYKAHKRKHVSDTDVVLTSVRSAADFGFGKEIDDMVANARRPWGVAPERFICSKMPALANIVKAYDEPSAGATSSEAEAFDAVEADIWESYLLSQLPLAERADAVARTRELYGVTREIVAPVIAGFADALLTEAGTRQLLCAGRDGLGTYLTAQVLKQKFDYGNSDPSQVVYAYLSRDLVLRHWGSLGEYSQERGVHDLAESVLLADIGMYGTFMSMLRTALPEVEPRFLISKNPDIPGFADSPMPGSRRMSAVANIGDNPAVWFLEDTFSGEISSPDGLIKKWGRLLPNTYDKTYPPDEALRRHFAAKALVDYAKSLEHRPAAGETDAAVDRLNLFLSNPQNYEHLMVPHEG